MRRLILALLLVSVSVAPAPGKGPPCDEMTCRKLLNLQAFSRETVISSVGKEEPPRGEKARGEGGRHVAVGPVGIADARWTTGFWAARFDVCRTTTVPAMGTL